MRNILLRRLVTCRGWPRTKQPQDQYGTVDTFGTCYQCNESDWQTKANNPPEEHCSAMPTAIKEHATNHIHGGSLTPIVLTFMTNLIFIFLTTPMPPLTIYDYSKRMSGRIYKPRHARGCSILVLTSSNGVAYHSPAHRAGILGGNRARAHRGKELPLGVNLLQTKRVKKDRSLRKDIFPCPSIVREMTIRP